MTTPDPLPTTDPFAQDAVTIIENLTKQGETAAEAAIITAVPVLGTPVLKQIWEQLFDWLVTLLLKPVASLGGRVVVDAQEYFALKYALKAQAALDAAKKAGDLNAVSQASQAVDQAIAGAVGYIGATRS